MGVNANAVAKRIVDTVELRDAAARIRKLWTAAQASGQWSMAEHEEFTKLCTEYGPDLAKAVLQHHGR